MGRFYISCFVVQLVVVSEGTLTDECSLDIFGSVGEYSMLACKMR